MGKERNAKAKKPKESGKDVNKERAEQRSVRVQEEEQASRPCNQEEG
jgi:hypothetical protein